MPKYTIGLDYGSLSGRAVLVDAGDGKIIAESVLDYKHAVISERLPGTDIKLPPDYALQDPRDYLQVLSTVVPDVIKKSGAAKEDIIGVGVDFTSCTVLPARSDGTPLCFLDKYKNDPHAYAKLWKHHAAQPYATKLNEIAAARGEKWLGRYGGKISSEWLFPKIWQVLAEDPEVYAEADCFVEASDWIVWQLTGVLKRAIPELGYKAIYDKTEGFPSPDFFAALDPRFENVVKDKLWGPVVDFGEKSGEISAEAAGKYGLAPGTAVSSGSLDAHVGALGVGAKKSGDMFIIMGTSTCHMLLGDEAKFVPGICGAVSDGILPGFIGYEAGQCCCGDHFAWFVDNFTPAAYKAEAERRGIPPIRLMIEKAALEKPGESGLIALDWWNGNRSVLVDADLSGLFIGMSLQTKPEEMLRALIEATAFGTKMIIENFKSHGVPVKNIIAAGGIARKDPFTMQMYSDICNLPIGVSASSQIPALSSAINGAYAAGSARGGYDTLGAAMAAMEAPLDREYTPDPEANAVYEKLYAEYVKLHDYFGRGENDVMKRLRKIRLETKR